MPIVSGGGGGAAFNGGTITQRLVVDTSSDAGAGTVFEGKANNAGVFAGVDLVLDAFGGLTITGSNGNSGVVTATDSTNISVLRASSGVSIGVETNNAILTRRHSAPPDGDLLAGDCALWFDQTNGAAKLMVKGKSADGTVVAAAIALA